MTSTVTNSQSGTTSASQSGSTSASGSTTGSSAAPAPSASFATSANNTSAPPAPALGDDLPSPSPVEPPYDCGCQEQKANLTAAGANQFDIAVATQEMCVSEM